MSSARRAISAGVTTRVRRSDNGGRELLAEAMLGGTIDCHSGVSDIWVCLEGHGYSMFILDFRTGPDIRFRAAIGEKVI